MSTLIKLKQIAGGNALQTDVDNLKIDVATEAEARENADDALQTAIDAINDEDSGVLANAKSYTDERETAITTAYQNYADGKNTALKSELLGNSNTTDSILGVKAAVSTEVTNRTNADNALDTRITTLEGTDTGSIASRIDSKIATLDVTDSAVTGQFVTAVSETDGKISVSRASLTTSDIPALAQSKITGLTDALAAKATNTALNTLSNRVTTAENTITTLNGSDTTSGSVAKAVKDAKDALLGTEVSPAAETIRGVKSRVDAFLNNAAISGEAIDTLVEIQNYISTDQTGSATMLQNIADNAAAIATLNGSDTTAGSVAKAVKDAKTALLGTENTAGGTIYGAKKDAADALTAANAVASNLATEVTNRTNADNALDTRIAVFEGDSNKSGSVANQVKVAKEAAAVDATTKANTALQNALAVDEKVVLKAVTFASVTANTENGFSVPMTPDAGYTLVAGSLAKVIVNGVVYIVPAATVTTVEVGFAAELTDNIFVEFREVAA